MLGELIKELKSLNSYPENVVVTQSEEAVGFFLNKTSKLNTCCIIGVLTKQLS
jgi:hypothetical protein